MGKVNRLISYPQYPNSVPGIYCRRLHLTINNYFQWLKNVCQQEEASRDQSISSHQINLQYLIQHLKYNTGMKCQNYFSIILVKRNQKFCNFLFLEKSMCNI